MNINPRFNFPAPNAVPDNSLQAATPEDGLRLAKRLAEVTRHNLGEDNKEADSAKAVGYLPRPSPTVPSVPLTPLVLSCFAIIAAANDYWR